MRSRTKRTSTRATRYRRHWPRVLGWTAGLALALGLIVVSAWMLGRKPPETTSTFFGAVLKACNRPAVALAIASAGLLHAAWCVRHLILHWLAWFPGAIEVRTFTRDTPLTEASEEQLTVDFRQRLMQLHLQAPTPVPGAAPQGHMLDVLESSSLESSNPISLLVGLLRAAIPSHAYEVHGSLRERETAPRYGVTVQVVSMGADSLQPTTFWGHTWEEALWRAADEATAAILPQTRQCKAPWGVWRGYAMPRGLLHEFETGARMEHERRYDEALHAYWRAVELDPMNMVLRLRVGQLQERLGLYLDALATFWGMDVTSTHAERRRRKGGKERREALVSARYRGNVLLGGRVLATQWCAPNGEPGSTLRDEQRERLRTCLRPRMQELMGERLEDADLSPLEPGNGVDFLALRELFAEYALADCKRLRRPFKRRSRLTRATVKLTEECINVRLNWVRHRRTKPGERWTPPQVAPAIARIERRHPLAFRQWHEQYNAACAWALALADDDLRETGNADDYAKAAVERLEKATARADSAYIASRRDWVLSEDPDLSALRSFHEFKEFELLYLPADTFTPGRPGNVQQIESSRYVRDLLTAVADRWQATWRERREQAVAEIDSTVVRGWFEDERKIWCRVQEVAFNFRHPKTRARLILDQRAAGAPLEVSFPQYERDPLCQRCKVDALDKAGFTVVEDANARLKELTEVLEPMLGHLDEWELELQERSAHARTVAPHALRQRCARHIAVWQRLGEWLEADTAVALVNGEAAMREAVEALDRAPAPSRNGHVSVSARPA
jgi:hypothetical protein